MTIRIELEYTYDFASALKRLARDPINALNLEEQSIRLPMKEGNIVHLQALGTKEAPVFHVSGAQNEDQVRRLREIFHFHQSLAPVTAHFLKTDLAPLFQSFEGMPLIRSFSLTGRLIKGIIHQQLNTSFANTLTMRFVERYGRQIDGVWTYPQVELVANLEVAALRELQFSQRKAEYVIGLSQEIVTGNLDLEGLARQSEERIVKELTRIRGIGPWTAQNFLLFALGKENLFPIGDVGLQNALKKVWGMDRKPTAAEMLAATSAWEPYASYAALYLWKSME